ncbi:MAG TPA: adenylate/guanylate cyclase domain-containing protein [Anaerolineaceae bacterium]|nr:adenylate/guanylate cyclase domain-containing protein [Anaerolineales bacterium]HIQ08888.1 adenylate/guanylate cyclase domain-containing protein [Anaerolineaceae bacterium]
MAQPSFETSGLRQRLASLRHLVRYLARVTRQDLPAMHTEWERLVALVEDIQRDVEALAVAHRQSLALMDVAQAMNSSLDLDTVLQMVIDYIIRLTQAERGFLMLREEQGELRTVIARHWEQEDLSPAELNFSRSIVQRVVATGEPVLTSNAQHDPRFRNGESVALYHLKSVICVPLKVKDRLVGVIYVDHRMRSGAFAPQHLGMLMAFAHQAATALENARLFQEVRRALAEVSQLKDLLDRVFASIASGVVTVDTEGRIVMCNRAAERLLCASFEEVKGYPWEQVLAPLASTLRSYWPVVVEEGREVVGVEVSPHWPGRGRVYWQLSMSPWYGENRQLLGATLVIHDLTEQRHLEEMQRIFERMVSPEVIRQLSWEQLRPGGERREITVVFADLRGFTALGEQVSPETLVTMLNRYLALAAGVLLEEGGTVDKFIGDAAMAWFNAPVPQPDHALRAVRAAWAMQQRLRQLHPQLPPAWRLGMGIGIHTGEAVIGLVGSERRLDYTVIGDAVNVAKRLEEAARPGQILLTEATWRLVQERVAVRPLPPLSVKGKKTPLRVYEMTGLR